jgi:tRNA-dihydrouridine synthase
MIGQAAIGNPWIFTPHTPTIQDRYEVARDHLYLLCAYSHYMTQTRALFPEESDQLALNRQHLHGIKKYDPDSDERSDLPSIARHDYVFPMPTMDVLSLYIADIRA